MIEHWVLVKFNSQQKFAQDSDRRNKIKLFYTCFDKGVSEHIEGVFS